MEVERTEEKEEQGGDADADTGRVPWCGHVATTYTLGACVLGGHHDADQKHQTLSPLALEQRVS